MNHHRRILAAVITLAGTVLALATAPAAFAHPLPPTDCCTSGAAAGVTVITGGGMPGWQITLIAAGAALAGAAMAVLLDRARAARKAHAAIALTLNRHTRPGRAPHNRLRGPGSNGPPNGPRTSRCARSRVAPAAAFRMTPGSRRYCQPGRHSGYVAVPRR
jgi:hypothetical protein